MRIRADDHIDVFSFTFSCSASLFGGRLKMQQISPIHHQSCTFNLEVFTDIRELTIFETISIIGLSASLILYTALILSIAMIKGKYQTISSKCLVYVLGF